MSAPAEIREEQISPGKRTWDPPIRSDSSAAGNVAPCQLAVTNLPMGPSIDLF